MVGEVGVGGLVAGFVTFVFEAGGGGFSIWGSEFVQVFLGFVGFGF